MTDLESCHDHKEEKVYVVPHTGYVVLQCKHCGAGDVLSPEQARARAIDVACEPEEFARVLEALGALHSAWRAWRQSGDDVEFVTWVCDTIGSRPKA